MIIEDFLCVWTQGVLASTLYRLELRTDLENLDQRQDESGSLIFVFAFVSPCRQHASAQVEFWYLLFFGKCASETAHRLNDGWGKSLPSGAPVAAASRPMPSVAC